MTGSLEHPVRCPTLTSNSRHAAQHDQQALQEKLECARRELEEERGVLERLRREAAARAEQDRATLNQLRDELARVHTRLEDFK